MVATVATCKGVQHGATIYHKCHCYMVLHCLLHRCHRKPLLVFALNNGRIFPHPGGQAVNVHGPHSSIYQSISVYLFFSMNCYLFWGPQGDHAFTNFSHGSARESAVKKGLNSQAKEASLQDESVTGRPVDWFSWFSKHIFQTPVYWSVRHCMILRCVCVCVGAGDTYPSHRSLQHYLPAVHDALLLIALDFNWNRTSALLWRFLLNKQGPNWSPRLSSGFSPSVRPELLKHLIIHFLIC